MRHATVTAIALALLAQTLLAQSKTPLKPTTPGSSGDPVWQGVVKMSDGRTFLTDGGMAIDTAVAKPAKLPEREFPGTILEKYFSAAHRDEYRFSDLTAVASGKTYTTPGGIPLNATYITYLRRILPASSVRFRLNGELEPVLVVADGKVVGVLMPVRK